MNLRTFFTYALVLFILSFLIGIFSMVSAFEGTYSDVSGSRALDTDYENTSGEDLFVFVTTTAGAGDAYLVTARIGASTANTDVASCSVRTDDPVERCQQTFVVPPDYFYAVDIIEGAAGLTDFEWWEYVTPAISGGGGAASAATTTIHNPTQDMFNGFLLFFLIALFLIWFFRRPYDTL